MTRKHYQMIAAVFAREVETRQGKPAQMEVVRDLARSLGAKLREDNPRFDIDIFMTACGILPSRGQA